MQDTRLDGQNVIAGLYQTTSKPDHWQTVLLPLRQFPSSILLLSHQGLFHQFGNGSAWEDDAQDC